MNIRLVLVALFSALFCFPCYASSASPSSASPSSAFSNGYDIPDFPESANYKDYVIVESKYTFTMNEDYTDYILFAFYSSPVITYGGYGFSNDELHFLGHLKSSYDAFLYSVSLEQWVRVGDDFGLFNIYNLETDKIIMSTSTIFYKDKLKAFYYYFPVKVTFESQPMLSNFVQVIYKIVISLISIIVLIICIRILLKMFKKLIYVFLRKGVL